MVRKKVDPRIRGLIENCIATGHRSFFVMIGDHGRDQVVHLHYILSKAQVATRPSILWCYKKDLGFSSHKQKRIKALDKKKKLQGKHSLIQEAIDNESSLDRFLTTTDIRYCYYKETDKILGNTYGMLILQDFEAITPNLLARTIETIQGGGMIILLLSDMKNLQQLYTLSMDVHQRYRTESTESVDIVSRFNERFLLSLADCKSCLVIDDELNVLPLSTHSQQMISQAEILEANLKETIRLEGERETQLLNLKESVADLQPMGPLLAKTKTLDQALALQGFISVINEKSLRSTCSLTAARGRGKSAALGLAIAAAISYGYSNIFVTSPHPDNLKTLFVFILKGFDALNYEEHTDYEVIKSGMNEKNGVENSVDSILRINLFRTGVHRQVIQYISPQDAAANKLLVSQAELVVIDEAAAIPLPIVKGLLGPYLVFLASTINGYEGTGRSLSLKLIQQLREQKSHNRSLSELKLDTPIRYKSGDSVERWLNQLLCLDCTISKANIPGGSPLPGKCSLYNVNRDTLFSYHAASEAFLSKMMSLYVASHYKNTPNDLQLLSDSPSQELFVLLPPIDSNSDESTLPEILCVVQVALEGKISRASVLKSLSRGIRSAGDLIPWTLEQQFQDTSFPELSGARIVRIATHPDYLKMGYGKRAISLLQDYYSGKFVNMMESNLLEEETVIHHHDNTLGDLSSIAPRDNLPPLLAGLDECKSSRLDYLGVSFGITPSLLSFWKKNGFLPVYLRQTPNELTGEFSTIFLKILDENISTWLSEYHLDFSRRFQSLLGYSAFSSFPSSFAMDIITSPYNKSTSKKNISLDHLRLFISPHDMKRLQSYSSSLIDHHIIIDLLPILASHFFSLFASEELELSPVQKTILLALGLQRKSIDALEKELKLPSAQLLAILTKIVKKIYSFYENIEKASYQETPVSQMNGVSVLSNEVAKKKVDEYDWDPTALSLDADLQLAGSAAEQAFKLKQRELINSLDLSSYIIRGEDEDWKAGTTSLISGHVSIKSESKPKASSSNASELPPGTFKALQEKHHSEKAKKLSMNMARRK